MDTVGFQKRLGVFLKTKDWNTERSPPAALGPPAASRTVSHHHRQRGPRSSARWACRLRSRASGRSARAGAGRTKGGVPPILGIEDSTGWTDLALRVADGAERGAPIVPENPDDDATESGRAVRGRGARVRLGKVRVEGTRTSAGRLVGCPRPPRKFLRSTPADSEGTFPFLVLVTLFSGASHQTIVAEFSLRWKRCKENA